MSTDAFQPPPKNNKPNFVFSAGDKVKTARDVRDVLRHGPNLFDRGAPVRLVQDGNTMRVEHLTPEMVAVELSNIARVFRLTITSNGDIIEKPASLPIAEGRMYLHLHGEHELRPLKGITSMPILHGDGRITCAAGYDEETGLWQHNVPKLNVPERPTYAEAEAALASLRHRFSTFPFADAEMVHDPALGATDPVSRVEKVKASDPMREHHTAIMLAWHAAHQSNPVAANDLEKPLADLIAPSASRQELAAKVRTLVGMRIGNMQLVVSRQATKNSPTLYMLIIEPG